MPSSAGLSAGSFVNGGEAICYFYQYILKTPMAQTQSIKMYHTRQPVATIFRIIIMAQAHQL